MAEDDPTAEEVSSQWPPVSVVSGAVSAGKGILMKGGFRYILQKMQHKLNNNYQLFYSSTNSSKSEKVVKFADGVRPGEGTSPSAGEELCSSSPKRVLPKEKRYTKTKIKNQSQKKKVKVCPFENTLNVVH